jgi:polyhydroxybutyrate depolymerase
VRRLALLGAALAAACGGGAADDPGAAADAAPSRTYGGDRPVTLQLPADFDASRSYPLVVVLHGYGATGLLQTAYLALADLPQDPGAFLLAPDGTVDATGRRFWAASDACCGSGGPVVDDVAYLGGLIDAITADWPVDPSRVVVIGHSNGHFMAYRLACERADVITAIAGLAGAARSIDGAGCAPARPLSVLHLHGTADTVVLYEGGSFGGVAYPGARASVEQWAGHVGCGGDAITLSEAGSIDLETRLAGLETRIEAVDACPAGIGVELWTIEGGSHAPSFYPSIGLTLAEWLFAHPRP